MSTVQIHQILIPVLVLVLSGLVGLVVKTVFEKIKTVETETKQIRTNYLDRFEKVQNQANENKEEILYSIGSLKIMLEREFVRKIECEKKH